MRILYNPENSSRYLSKPDTLSSCSLVTFVSFVVMVVPQGTLSRLAAIHLVPQGTLSRLAAIHLVRNPN